jgi:cell pole-organizing protein PopZ
MTHPAKAQEPSMDEILASIRRMIAPDNTGKNDATASELANPAAAPPAASSANPTPAPLAAPSYPGRAGTPGTQAFSSASYEGTRFGKRASAAQPLSSPPQPSLSSPSGTDMSGPAREAEHSAFPKIDTRVDAAAEESEARADRGTYRSSHSAPAGLARSETESAAPRARTAAEPLAARESSQPGSAEPLSPATTAAVGAAFDALTAAVAAARSPRTLEDVVCDALRPMLKVWLDDNLPQLVERLVLAEIERISRGR